MKKHTSKLASSYTFWRVEIIIWRDGGMWSVENTPECLAVSLWRFDLIWDKGRTK